MFANGGYTFGSRETFNGSRDFDGRRCGNGFIDDSVFFGSPVKRPDENFSNKIDDVGKKLTFDDIIESYTQVTDVVLKSFYDEERNFFCHSFVLAKSSEIFKEIFGNVHVYDRFGRKIIETVEDAETLESILVYVYSDRFHSNSSASSVAKCLLASETYRLTGLKRRCVDALVGFMNSENVFDAYDVGDKHGVESLTEACVDFVASRFESFSKIDKVYIALLQRPPMMIGVSAKIKSLAKER